MHKVSHYVTFTQRNQRALIAGANYQFQNGGGDGVGEEKTRIKCAARGKRLAENNSIVSDCFHTRVDFLLLF